MPTQPQNTHQQLQQLAVQVATTCPDMRQLARETAQSILEKHHQPQLDPDQVYLHLFHTAQSSPKTFSGWQHFETPFQSLTLPQLVMQRFDVNAQDNEDLLGYLSGFYKEGPGKDVFDEHNEVPIAPKDVLEDFWQIDFSRDFHHRLDEFWRLHADDYRTLAKINFIAKVIEVSAEDNKSELATRARQVAQALVGITNWPPTLEELEREVVPDHRYRLCTFDIGGYIASDILRIEMEDGFQLLYTPGETDALHLFANSDELYWWVLINSNHADNRTRLMSHFALSSHAEAGSSVGLNHLIDLLFYHWGAADQHSLNHVDQTLSGDAFSRLRDAARQRMIDDAELALHSNADLRKQLWIGYLRTFGQIAGPMAAVDWPIALAVVGAGLAETGLNIDQAMHGHTTAERRAGITGAIFAGINTLFNAATFASAFAEPIADPEPLGDTEQPGTENPPPGDVENIAEPSEIKAWVPEPFQFKPQAQLLEPFETNVLLSGDPGSGALEGIYTQNGATYVQIDDFPYRVRYVEEMRTWIVIDPENPFSFYQNVPIRMTPQGTWQPVARAGLRGGGMPRRLLGLWGRPSSRPAVPDLPLTVYDIAPSMRPHFKTVGDSSIRRLASESYYDPDPLVQEVTAEYNGLRDRLAADAKTFIDSATLPTRPQLPEFAAQASPKQIFSSIYEKADGFVIGESHSSIGSKRLLIDNMALLKKQKVKVLYMEHFTTDFQQIDLDLFNRTGEMPEALERYVKAQDIGHGTDPSGRYTFKEVLVTAQKNGIRVQSIDCYVSYHQYWSDPPSPLMRQQMMNFYAHLIIDADQSVRGSSKWVALLGNSHVNTFETVPGVCEMQGAIGLRVEDIDVGQVGSVSVDPGLTVIQDDLSVKHVKSDLRLQVAIKPHRPELISLEQELDTPGRFTFIVQNEQLTLAHRSASKELVFTPIHTEGMYLYINNPRWPQVSGRRLQHLWQLREALSNQRMQYTRTLNSR